MYRHSLVHIGRHLRRHVLGRSFHGILLLCTAVGLNTLTACGSSDSTSPSNAAETLWAVQLNQHAVTLALTPGADTVQLRVAATTQTGALLASPFHVTYVAADSTVVVDSTGFVTAKFETQGLTHVTATIKVGNLTLSDTTMIKVTSTAPPAPVATLSIQPQGGDSARGAAQASPWTGGLGYPLPPLIVYATDRNGGVLSNASSDTLLVHFTSSDRTRARIDANGQIVGLVPGKVTIYADADLYGVTRRDSLVYTIGNPIYVTIEVLSRTPVSSLTPVLYFQPAYMKVGVGGEVAWENTNADSIDVVFDDPTQVPAIDSACWFTAVECGGYPPTGTGNIPAWTINSLSSNGTERSGDRVRRFTKPGTYRYHSTRYPGSTGVIEVAAP